MKIQFTYDEMIARRGCYDINKVPSHEWMFSSPVQLSDMLSDPRISLVEKSWFLSNSCDATDEELVELARLSAEAVLPLWREKFPDREPIPANGIYAEPRLALIPQAFHALKAKDRIYAAAKAATGTIKENEILKLYKDVINKLNNNLPTLF